MISAQMLTGIPEVDLGIDVKIQNIHICHCYQVNLKPYSVLESMYLWLHIIWITK